MGDNEEHTIAEDFVVTKYKMAGEIVNREYGQEGNDGGFQPFMRQVYRASMFDGSAWEDWLFAPFVLPHGFLATIWWRCRVACNPLGPSEPCCREDTLKQGHSSRESGSLAAFPRAASGNIANRALHGTSCYHNIAHFHDDHLKQHEAPVMLSIHMFQYWRPFSFAT